MKPHLPLLTLLTALTPAAAAQTYSVGTLTPAATSPDDLIGAAVDARDGRAIVGGYAHDFQGSGNWGGAWIYERLPGGSWSEVALLVPSDTPPSSRFGYAVQIDGDVAMVGAYRDDTLANDAGAVYVFERDPLGNWIEVQKLVASDWSAGDEFGLALALDGDRLAVGAPGRTGLCYVFERQPDGTWLEVAKPVVVDGLGNDEFGHAIALNGERLVAGARLQDDNGNSSGAAYALDRQPDGSWVLDGKLLASDGASIDYFGSSVAMAGDRVAVGARLDDDGGSGSGGAYVFERQPDGSWLELQKLSPPTAMSGAQYGSSIAMDGDAILVGAIFERVNNKLDAGAAHLWSVEEGGTYAYAGLLTDATPASDENFGQAVSLHEGLALIGSPDNDEVASNGGLARLFFGYPGSGEAAPEVVGAGTPGCDGPQVLSTNLPPRLDTAAFAFECTGAPASSVGFLFLGTVSNPGVSIGFGLLLHVDPFLSNPLLSFPMATDAAGLGTTPLPLPNSPSLAGKTLTAQSVFAWASCSLPPSQLSSSNGLTFTLFD